MFGDGCQDMQCQTRCMRVDYGKDAWVFLFVASFVLSIIAGLIQHSRRQEPSESPMIPLLAVLHFLWVWILTLWLIASALYSISRLVRQ